MVMFTMTMQRLMYVLQELWLPSHVTLTTGDKDPNQQLVRLQDPGITTFQNV